MDDFESHRNRKKRGRARARQTARKQRRIPEGSRAQRRALDKPLPTSEPISRLTPIGGPWAKTIQDRARTVLRDLGWHIRNNPVIVRSVGFVVLLVIVLYLLSFLFSGNILPRISSIDVDLSGLSVEEAEVSLRSAWRDHIQLELVTEGEIVDVIHPEVLGIRFDAARTAANAKNVGMSAIPFGRTIAPVVEIDRLTAQNYLLELADKVDVRPFSAGYEWSSGELRGIDGNFGRRLDVPLTIEQLFQDSSDILNRGRLELLMIPLPPEARDPEPYMDQVRMLISQPIQLNGFDPYRNQFFAWPISAENFTSWLAAGATSLTLREEAFLPFLDAFNTTLNPEDENTRYLAPVEVTNKLREAIAIGQTSVDLRIRYRPTTYTVVQGDTGYEISRKTGIPFYLIEEENSGRNLDTLSIGDEISIPSRDETMLEDPIPNKRIVVDIRSQYLVAFENGQVVFQWPISTGVPGAETFPGVFQILSHEEFGYGSSNILCNLASVQCGQWKMSWFMGIYQIQEGLVNGFHGSVLLPNGSYLGNGAIGEPVTFGCVMSGEEEAQRLYDWAEIGTVVEILSDLYAPKSDLGRIGQNIAQAQGNNA